MEDNDDWKLGDEGEATSCARCGKRNRAGLTHCVICGSLLGDELEADPGSLRTIGEAMGGARRVRRIAAAPSLRVWSIAATVLLVVVVVLTWLQTRDQPFQLEDQKVPAPVTPPPPVPTAIATQGIAPTKRPAPPSPVVTIVRPAPTVVPTSTPVLPRPVATARVVVPSRRVVAPALRPPVPTPNRGPVTEPAAEPTFDAQPRRDATEKPSLGTDLQDATRAYRQAVEGHNARVDEYNALADEIQRRNAFDDSEGSVELRRRLDRAREAVESARVNAEMLRTRMESVRARYR